MWILNVFNYLDFVKGEHVENISVIPIYTELIDCINYVPFTSVYDTPPQCNWRDLLENIPNVILIELIDGT